MKAIVHDPEYVGFRRATAHALRDVLRLRREYRSAALKNDRRRNERGYANDRLGEWALRRAALAIRELDPAPLTRAERLTTTRKVVHR